MTIVQEKEINSQNKFKKQRVKKSASCKPGVPIAETAITLSLEKQAH